MWCVMCCAMLCSILHVLHEQVHTWCVCVYKFYTFLGKVAEFREVTISVLARPFWSGAVCLVHHLVSSRKPFCTTWFDSNYDFIVQSRLTST